jgi:hypothetical protein
METYDTDLAREMSEQLALDRIHELEGPLSPPSHMETLGIEGHWIGIHDADPRAIPIYRRHYSARLTKGGTNKEGFAGVGSKMVLLTVACDALFVWLKCNPELRGDKQIGVNCTIFRNEGPFLSSELIKEADELAWGRWPGERLFTYVWDSKVQSANPGYCFKMAGWSTVGRNKDGRLTLLEHLP